MILEFLQYRTLTSTSSEILKLLLFISNPLHDFTKIISQTNEYIFNALLRYELANFNTATIAIGSLLVLCEDLDFINFQNGILELIQQEDLPFDMH